MGLLDALLGGGQGAEDQHGFLQRFEHGQPWEGYSDQEVLTRYGTVAGQASPQEYEQAASEAFARMSPEQRVEFGRLLQQRARERKLQLDDLEHSGINDFQDTQRLARLTSEVHQRPGLLRSMLGGSGEQQQSSQQAGLLGSPLAKAALAGIAAMAIKKVLGSRSASAGPQTTTGGTRSAPVDIPSPPRTQESTRETTRTTAGAAPTTAAPTAAAAERWHEVTAGETLWKISARYYGNGQQYTRIFEANRDVLSDPDKIRPGQRLRIP